MGKRFLQSALIVILGLLSVAGQQPDEKKLRGCTAADPTGYFEGSAKSQEAGELSVSLNLRCTDGRYEGNLLTPVGDFPLKAVSFESGQARIQFDAGGDTGTIEARLDGTNLHGAFRLANDAGAIELRRVSDAKPPTPTAPTLQLTPAQWREDLRFFAEELPKRHANAFQNISRARFKEEVAALDAKLDHLNGDEAYAGIDRIAQMIGDGHTYVQFPPDSANFPLDIRQFGDEFRIAAVKEGYERALGARVIKIQDMPTAKVHDLLLQFTPQAETRILADARIEDFLAMGMLLHAVGVIPDRNTARYTLADDAGRESTVEVYALAPDDKAKWVFPFKERPLYRQRPGESFWYTYLPASRTIYCSFRGYANLAENAKRLLELVKEKHPDKLVIDMRLNFGGDYHDGEKYLIDPIRALPDINRKGHLFVLISPYTFSAGMSNAAQFHTQSAAMLVGQAIGERPNSYQEPREMRLPNSRLVVRYSTQFYKFVESGKNLIRPDREVIPSWADFKSGRDTVLEWVLAQRT